MTENRMVSFPRLPLALFPHIIIFLGVALLQSCAHRSRAAHHFDTETEASLEALNRTIAEAPKYQRIKDMMVDSLRHNFYSSDNVGAKARTAVALAKIFRQTNADSAIYYGRFAVDLLPKSAELQHDFAGHIALANALSTAGIFSPAINMLDSIAPQLTEMGDKIEFWKAQRMLFSYMLGYVHAHGYYADLYRARYVSVDDSLLANLPQKDLFRHFIACERHVAQGRWAQAQGGLEQLLKDTEKETNLYGMASYQLAQVCKQRGDFGGYVRNLAAASESDLLGCVKDGLALPTLANWLYEQGDLDNAFKYINYALEEANIGNIRMRTVSIAALMPMIDEAYRRKIDDSRNMMMGYLIVSAALLLVLGGLLFFMVRNWHRLRENRRSLAQTSKKLEAYVGNFISLCSNYASRFDQLLHLVTRKLNSGQPDELLKIINSGKFAQDANEEFYRLIDKALLDIFPDFVPLVNTLLLPDKQIVPSEGGALIPELRIYAFVRLGVDQSSKIAQILNYSVNTVYAYRNRMRVRAIDRDNFDRDVAKLGDNQRHEFYI